MPGHRLRARPSENQRTHDSRIVGAATDDEAVDAFFRLSRLGEIIPAPESARAVAHAISLAKNRPAQDILVNLGGRTGEEFRLNITRKTASN
jgi:tryptophan synthase beta subunit